MMRRSVFKALPIVAAAVGGFLFAPSQSSAATFYDTDIGQVAVAHQFMAMSSGDVDVYFAGASSDFNETLGFAVNGVVKASDLFDNNQSSIFGSMIDVGRVDAGDALSFFIDVSTTNHSYSTDERANADHVNHVFALNYGGGGFGLPAGTYLGFEDWWGGGDLDYNDDTFFVTNMRAMSPVPLPPTAALLGGALAGVGLAGAARRRRAPAAS